MDTKEKIRKQYKKPKLSQVKLEVEEAVLTACKNSTSTGKTVLGCQEGVSNACQKTFVGS
jgi:hypothetical protein